MKCCEQIFHIPRVRKFSGNLIPNVAISQIVYKVIDAIQIFLNQDCWQFYFARKKVKAMINEGN